MPQQPTGPTGYQPGEIVDITIRGARVMKPHHSQDTTLTVALSEAAPGVWRTLRLDHPDDEMIVIDRVAGPDWPPKPGEIWRSMAQGYQRDYFVRVHECADPDCTDPIELVVAEALPPISIGSAVPALLRPMVRIYPEPSAITRDAWAGAVHMTRGTTPGELEDCLCGKAPCGAVDSTKTHPACDQHPAERARTMRQIHPADQCPGGEPR